MTTERTEASRKAVLAGYEPFACPSCWTYKLVRSALRAVCDKCGWTTDNLEGVVKMPQDNAPTSAPQTSEQSEKKANDYQVGGEHYRKTPGEQHWDRVWRLFGPGYFIGNITAYVERYQDKNGIQDLRKAQHYIQKLIELEEAKAAAKGRTEAKETK